MPDEPIKSKKPLAIIVLLLLLCAILGAWFFFSSRRAKTPNAAPVAALRLDSINETNRVATLSDAGSRDPDGTLLSWRIAWGDGKEEDLSAVPQKAAHTYASEGEYMITLSCVDNLGATSSPPAMTNITFDFLKRQKAAELAQAEADAKRQADAKREADRLKAEEAKKLAARLEQDKQMQLAAQEAQKAKEQQELEAKRKAQAEADAELARQKAVAATPAPPPLGFALSDKPSSRQVIYTPEGWALGEFQINKEKTEGKASNGNSLVVLVTRCVNFPGLPIPTSDWQFDGKGTHVQAGRIRASLSPGRHEVTAVFTPKGGLQPKELKADVTVEASGDCVVVPRK